MSSWTVAAVAFVVPSLIALLVLSVALFVGVPRDPTELFLHIEDRL
jgi:hypothetical protein